MEEKIYSKKSTTSQEQLRLLKSKGLLIRDEEKALKILTSVGYYRFVAYYRPFQIKQKSDQVKINTNINFEDVWDLYVFDRKLRLLLLDAIERIEVAFRVAISDTMSIKYGAFWYLQENCFEHGHNKHLLNKIDKILRDRNKPFIIHYLKNYTYPAYPPSWMVVECLSFGDWSRVFSDLRHWHDQREIADKIGRSFHILESWMRCLTDLKNKCAHHERVWNAFHTR